MIKQIRHYAQNSLCGYFWRRCKRWKYERYTLPSAVSHSLEGVILSLDGLSTRLKRSIIEGTYEKAEVAIARQLVCEGDRILELGGAIGFVGLFCLTRLKAISVVSIEANPDTANRLERNYKMNQRRPHIIVAAVSAADGTMELGVGRDFWEDSLTFSGEHLRRITVRTVSLSSVLAQSDVAFNCFIADVEGAETQIGWDAMPPSVERVIIELHPEIVGFPASYRVLQKLQNLGFEVACQMGSVYGLTRGPIALQESG